MSTVPELFDVNGSFGRPSTGVSEYPQIRDRLAAMDRLGVSRSLVWNTESTQNHALTSNRKMLEEIRRTPGAEGRIFPALTLTSLIIYERNGLDALIAQFGSIPCRALRFADSLVRLSLMQMAPVVNRLRARKPFIILRHDQTTIADILEFTDTFPNIPLILTEAMWPQHVILFDLMRRRKNILCDISWMHTFGTLELMAREFGADRLVFGLGNKSHNGAAIAALARAELSIAQRRQIAHGNLDRLTGLGKTPSVAQHWTSNTLWPRFLEGEPLAEVDIVDAHGHLGPSAGYVLETHEEHAQLQVALRAMDRVGIRTFIVSGLQALLGAPVEGNVLLEDVVRSHTDRVSGYFTFNPFYATELVTHFHASFTGSFFVGFKTLCDYWKVKITDERFNPMWQYASRHRLPVLSHTWDGSYDTPMLFRDLARRYPRIPFLLGHSGGGASGRSEAEALARECPNVYLEWCGSFCNPCSWEETLRTVDPRQVVFGSDAMAHSFDWELGRLLSLDVPDDVLLSILGGNMRRILAQRVPTATAPRQKRVLSKSKTGKKL